jgi:hypothetical protein
VRARRAARSSGVSLSATRKWYKSKTLAGDHR